MRYFRNINWPLGNCINYKNVLKKVREDNWHLRKEYATYQEFMDKVVTVIIEATYEEIPEAKVTGWDLKAGAYRYKY